MEHRCGDDGSFHLCDGGVRPACRRKSFAVSTLHGRCSPVHDGRPGELCGLLPEQHLTPQDPWAYFTQPTSYKNLQCKDGSTQHSCQEYREQGGLALAYNESLSMMKALAEAALAADRLCTEGLPMALPPIWHWPQSRAAADVTGFTY